MATEAVNTWGLRALEAALERDPDGYPQADDCIARLNATQREELDEALDALRDIIAGMRGAS